MRAPFTYFSLFCLLSASLFYGCATLRGSDQSVEDPAPEQQESVVEQEEAAIEAPPPEPVDLTPMLADGSNTVRAALERASVGAIGAQRLPTEPLTYREILDPGRTIEGSLSLGTTRTGALRNSVALAVDGEHHQIIERHRLRNTRYGTKELVRAIERAAAVVAEEHGGAPLRVGNLGFRSGGSIPWSNSHEAGRDADLAFYAVNAAGESVPTPDLIAFDNDGLARGHSLFFDVPRNWTLVRALLTDETINVQWLFVSEGLKELLLLHALEIGEERDIIERASRVLHQPTDAPPHDDHLHLRIGCSLADRLEGCVDFGPRWAWYDWHDKALLARTMEVQRALSDPSPQLRLRALEFLLNIRSPFAAEVALHSGITDENDEVRSQAYRLLQEIAPRSEAGLFFLDRALSREDLHTEEREVLYAVLRRVSLAGAIPIATRRYQNQELSREERTLALRALEHHMELELIPFYLEALASEPLPELRAILARQLYRVAARNDGVDWRVATLTEEHHLALQQWNAWWEDAPRARDLLLQDLLARLGVENWADLQEVDALLPYLRAADDHKRYNVNLILSQWTGRWAPSDWESEEHAHRFWTRWWNRNRERMIEARPRAWEAE